MRDPREILTEMNEARVLNAAYAPNYFDLPIDQRDPAEFDRIIAESRKLNGRVADLHEELTQAIQVQLKADARDLEHFRRSAVTLGRLIRERLIPGEELTYDEIELVAKLTIRAGTSDPGIASYTLAELREESSYTRKVRAALGALPQADQ